MTYEGIDGAGFELIFGLLFWIGIFGGIVAWIVDEVKS